MAMQISNWLSAQLLNSAFRGVAFTPPPKIYLALYTSDPTAADTGQEVVGGGYARQEIVFSSAVIESGKMTIKNSVNIAFPVATADWNLITHVGLRTALTGGNLMSSNALLNPRTILINDNPKFLKDGTLVRFNQ